MRISDWSSDVCSSDLVDRPVGDHPTQNEVKAVGIYGVEVRTTDPDVTRGRERSAGLQYAARQFEAAGDIAKRSVRRDVERAGIDKRRSEEHTSELQSLMRISYAVFCLKKNTKKEINNTQY